MLEALGSFQKNVVIIACVVLIIAIAFIGWILSSGVNDMPWPPSVSNCPDYWEDQQGDGTSCFNSKRLGKCGIGPYNLKGWNKPNSACASKGMMEACDLTWDGITSLDACSDSYKKRAVADGTW